MTERNHLAPDDDLEALLPWYVNGKLDPQSRHRIEKALESNERLRKALDLAREDRDATIDDNERLPAPRSDVLARIMAEVEASPEARRSIIKLSIAARLEAFMAALAPRTLAYAAIAAVLLLAIQAGAISALLTGQDRSSGPQLASVPSESGDARPKLRVIVKFTAASTVDGVTSLLDEVGGKIIDGPTPGALYVVEFAVPNDGQDNVDALLQKLRSKRDIVEFASPSKP